MAVITGKTITGVDSAQLIESDKAAGRDSIELAGLPYTVSRCFAAAQFFDAQGDPVVPTAGTVTIEILTVLNDPNYETPAGTSINATAPATVTWLAPTLGARVTLSGVTGVTSWSVKMLFVPA